MPKTLLTWFAPLLLLAGGVFVSPANAGVKIGGITNTATGFKSVAFEVSHCIGYVFKTQAGALACLDAGARSMSGQVIQSSVSTGSWPFRKESETVCKDAGSSPPSARIMSARQGTWSLNSGHHWYYAQFDMSSPAPHFYEYHMNSTCTQRLTVSASWFSVNLINVPEEEGGDGPGDTDPEEDTCQLNAQWAALALPRLPAGSKPAVGHEFSVAYQGDFAYPAHFTDGGTTTSPVSPGSILRLKVDATHTCIFLREHRNKIVDAKGHVIYNYTLSYMGPGTPAADGAQESGQSAHEIVVTGSSKKSKPIVAYGKQFTNEVAYAESYLERAIEEMRKDLSQISSLRTSKNQPIPVTVKVECERPIGNSCLTDYHHPAPEKLVRDNPGCTAQFDPRCAWSPSPTEPAKPETKKEDLVRLSNDGQTIVHNNTNIYNNTIYPTAMVEAGTAPDNSKEDGSIDNPSDGSEDGDDGGLTKAAGKIAECVADGTCDVNEETIAEYLKANGFEGDADAKFDGVTASVLGKAMKAGKCQGEDKGIYCGLATGMAGLANRAVPQGDFIIWEGKIRYGGDEEFHQVKLPRSILDFLRLILKIGTALSVISITLRGRPW